MYRFTQFVPNPPFFHDREEVGILLSCVEPGALILVKYSKEAHPRASLLYTVQEARRRELRIDEDCPVHLEVRPKEGPSSLLDAPALFQCLFAGVYGDFPLDIEGYLRCHHFAPL